MPRVQLNVQDAQSMAPVPDGVYPAKVIDFDGPTKGPKSTYLTAVCEISDGDHAGRKLFNNLPLDGKGAGITARFLSKCRPNDPEIEVGEGKEDLDFDTDDYLDCEIQIVVKNEEYPEGSGEMQPKISRVLAVGEDPKAKRSASKGESTPEEGRSSRRARR